MQFVKYHALGNDYLVIDRAELDHDLTTEEIVRICHRNYGVGSDGILLYEGKRPGGFVVRIFNPDGSEAENSGSGMRIFSRFLFDRGLVDDRPFSLLAGGEREITSRVYPATLELEVEMGRATFISDEIPVLGPRREVLGEKLELLGETLLVNCVAVGNPHCVILGRGDISADILRFGPLLEVHERFPNRINIQFANVIDAKTIRLEIWERGAGYTLASGTSACAVAAVSRKLGLTDNGVTIQSPGGKLYVEVSPDFQLKIRGAVARVANGEIHPEAFAHRAPTGKVY